MRLTTVYQNNVPSMGNDGKPNTIQYLVPLSQSHSERWEVRWYKFCHSQRIIVHFSWNTCPNNACSDNTCPNNACPDNACSNNTCSDNACSDNTCSDNTCSDNTCSDNNASSNNTFSDNTTSNIKLLLYFWTRRDLFSVRCYFWRLWLVRQNGMFWFLNACPFDVTTVAGSWKVGSLNRSLTTFVGWPSEVGPLLFLAHLSRRLKWAIVIAHRPSSVRPSVRKLSHFRNLLWNRWTEFNETWQKARSQHPLQSMCFSVPSKKQDGHPYLWLAEKFSASPLKRLNGIQRNLTGSKNSTPSTKFVFFGLIGKNKMAALASDWLRHFRLLLWNRWTEFHET